MHPVTPFISLVRSMYNGLDLASDGGCDDGGPDSAYALCGYGNDCTDCGGRHQSPPSPPPSPPPPSPPPSPP
eukprot:scaffold92440_cov18-Phaeocystis_antarctica.AAC.1